VCSEVLGNSRAAGALWADQGDSCAPPAQSCWLSSPCTCAVGLLGRLQELPNLSAGPGAVVLTSKRRELPSKFSCGPPERGHQPVQWLLLCAKGFPYLCWSFYFPIHFCHADSCIFPACQTNAFSVPLQEREQKLSTHVITSLTDCLKFLESWV